MNGRETAVTADGASLPSRGDCSVSPPVTLALDVFARSLAQIGRADDDDLEALRPGFVASPRTRRDAHHVPLLELDDLVVEFHPPAPAHDHVRLLLLLVRVAVGKAIAGRDALVAQAGLLELERLGRQAELQVRCAVEIGPDVLEVLLQVPERERQRGNPSTDDALLSGGAPARAGPVRCAAQLAAEGLHERHGPGVCPELRAARPAGLRLEPDGLRPDRVGLATGVWFAGTSSTRHLADRN